MPLKFPFVKSRKSKRIPVLTYHALHAPGTDYIDNDHIALEEDLKIVHKLGFRVAPLHEIARLSWDPEGSSLADEKWVGLGFDDGTDFDYLDLDHPHLGYIKSFYTILREAGKTFGDSPSPSGVSFVIASPDARRVLDQTCIAGRDNWRDVWWEDAARTGILQIGNHSWDHTHETLETVAQREQRKGTFLGIDTIEDADAQIIQADSYIRHRTNGLATRLFAYPYGEASDYLVNEYFPGNMKRHGQLAAFGTGGRYVTHESNRWNIPRFVCGEHWRKPEELESILLMRG